MEMHIFFNPETLKLIVHNLIEITPVFKVLPEQIYKGDSPDHPWNWI